MASPLSHQAVFAPEFHLVVRRAFAYTIDGVVSLGITVVPIALQDVAYGNLLQFIVTWVVLGTAYRITSESLFGTTLGKAVFGLHVIGFEGGRPTFLQCLFRGVFGLFELNPFVGGLLISWVSVAFTKENQRLGDIISGTQVVQSEYDMIYHFKGFLHHKMRTIA